MSNFSEYLSQEEQELFEQFLLGQMNAGEEEQFRMKLANDLKFSENFQQFKIMFRTVEEDGLRLMFNEIHTETEEVNHKIKLKRPFQRYQLFIAAAISLLIVIGGGYLFLNKGNSNAALYKKYYSVDPGLPTVMGESNNYEFYVGMVDYKQGKYEVAIEKWNNLLKENRNNDTLNYFLGSAYFAKNNEKEAAPFFEKVTKNEQSSFYNDSQFYLGLIALKEGETQIAKTHFEFSKQVKSDEILKQLKSK